MDVEENVEDFLEKVKQLDLQRQQEDEYRRRRLEDDIQSFKTREIHNISIPNPIARQESSANRSLIPKSDSLQSFNMNVSTQYRIDIDDLVYESAYNYEKSQKDNDKNTGPGGDHDAFSASTGTISREKTYKKYDNIPDIIRFDDTMAKSTPNYSKSSRYSKFQLTDEQKKSIDRTVQGLIGHDHKVTEFEEDENEPPTAVKPLVRERKGGQFALSTPMTPQFNSGWSNAAKQKPSLAPPATISNQTSQLKRSPRKTELITSPARPEFTSPIKKSPAKLDFSRYTGEEKVKPPPPIAPKPQGFKNNDVKKDSWLNSAVKNSSSTPQWQNTTSKIHLNNADDKQASWLKSAYKNSSSTPQWQDTTPKLQLNNNDDQKASWLNSAMQKTPHKEFELPKSKIKPVVPSKSNTLAKMLETDEESKEKQHSTLKELESQKLNHIDAPNSKSISKFEQELKYTPTILKKTRSSSPIRHQSTNEEEAPDIIKRLSPLPRSAALSPLTNNTPSPEALSQKGKLKPALPARKISLEVPEALRKADKLKPALPKRKPSIKIPEALSQKEQLRQAAKKEEVEEPTPEAVNQKSQLKPALPKRKPSLKEVEALAQLSKLKSKSKGTPPPGIKPKPRVFSNSKEILQNQLGSLKSTKKLEKEEASLNLERILKKATTDSELKPVRLPFMAQTDEMPNIKKGFQKASTFDNSDLQSDKRASENLEHLTKKRTKGPKRRAPKKI